MANQQYQYHYPFTLGLGFLCLHQRQTTDSISVHLFQMAVNQVVHKFQDIDPDVWCKILYMEYGKIVAKFYICDKEVVIDGSTQEFTGQR